MSKLEKFSNLMIAAGAGLGFTSFFFKSFFYTVDAGNLIFISGERAILFDKAFGGISDKIKGEGMHFYIPFM